MSYKVVSEVDAVNIGVVTHDGVFHSDEIFAIALLGRFYYDGSDTIGICRTREERVLNKYKKRNDVFVIDVGGLYQPEQKNFDHHQEDLIVEEKASVLLILDYLLQQHTIEQALYDFLFRKLIQFISNWDLGLEQNRANFSHKPLPTIISAFNRYDVEPEEENAQFEHSHF